VGHVDDAELIEEDEEDGDLKHDVHIFASNAQTDFEVGVSGHLEVEYSLHLLGLQDDQAERKEM
jgi:hypothetical protein